jgi:hypothetical protein
MDSLRWSILDAYIIDRGGMHAEFLVCAFRDCWPAGSSNAMLRLIYRAEITRLCTEQRAWHRFC